MWQFLRASSLAILGMLILSGCGTQGRNTVEVVQGPQGPMVMTNVPAPKEVVMAPSGYVKCVVAPAGYYQGHWIPEHRVCTYKNQPGRAAWVEGYWSCATNHVSSGRCAFWKWNQGHWVKTYRVY